MGLIWASVPDSEPLEQGERYRVASRVSLENIPDFLRGELDNVFPAQDSQEWRDLVQSSEESTNERLGATNIEVTSAGYTREDQTTWKFEWQYRVTQGDGSRTVGEVTVSDELGASTEYISSEQIYQEKFSMLRVAIALVVLIILAISAGVVAL